MQKQEREVSRMLLTEHDWLLWLIQLLNAVEPGIRWVPGRSRSPLRVGEHAISHR